MPQSEALPLHKLYTCVSSNSPQLNTLGDVKLLIVAMHGGHWNFVLGGGIFMVVVTATLAVKNRVSMQTKPQLNHNPKTT